MNLLIIEDDLDLCSILKEEIEERRPEAKIRFAHNEAKGLEQLEKDEPTHVLLDLVLPGSNGIDIAKKIQKKNSAIKIVLMSGFASEIELAPARVLGISSILSKPFDYDLMIEELEKKEDGNLDYYPINIEYLENSLSYPFDVFVRLNEAKYLKIFPKLESVEESRIEKFYQQGIRYLFVKKVEYLEIIDQLYVPVRRNILMPDAIVPFALYKNNQFKFDLYQEANEILSREAHAKLKEDQIKVLYIRDSDEEKFEAYLEGTIDKILDSDNYTEEEKSVQLNEYAKSKVESVFFNPNAKELKDLVKVQENMKGFIGSSESALSKFYEASEEETGLHQHSINVSALSYGIFMMINKDKKENPKSAFKEVFIESEDAKDTICLAGLLHDIGETVLKTKALEEDTDLTEEMIKEEHPKVAIELLSHYDFISDKILEIIENHEEYCDRSGKMKKMKSNLSFFTQIISLTNYYDELVTIKGLTKGQALVEVKANDKKFNTKLIPLLEKIVTINSNLETN